MAATGTDKTPRPLSTTAEPATPSPPFTGAPLFPLPSAEPTSLAPNVKLQAPLTRRGHGPGLLLVVPAPVAAGGLGRIEEEETKEEEVHLDPSPLVKWAEEGYAVLQVEVEATSAGAGKAKETEKEGGGWAIEKVLDEGVKRLLEMKECSSERVGIIVYEPTALDKLLVALMSFPHFKCLVTFSSFWEEPAIPTLQHLSLDDPKASLTAPTSTALPPSSETGGSGSSTPTVPTKSFTYPASSPYFALPDRKETYQAHPAAVAHSRTLEFLKKREHLGGPVFDLETLWDEHTYYEFQERSAEKTLAAEPYVNHIPTLTGGIGRADLTKFYRDVFIPSNPKDSEIHLISRTVGVVDEFIFTMTHDQSVPHILPGIPPTGKKLEFPVVSVVSFRGDRLFSEHIHWDQSTVLSQLSLLPSHMPCASPSTDGKEPLVRLPVSQGAEAAKKLGHGQAVKSNEMLEEGWGREGAKKG
ncbi:hypothetical protein JCM6882_000604 [Rhodosporidiobolus microsporus]